MTVQPTTDERCVPIRDLPPDLLQSTLREVAEAPAGVARRLSAEALGTFFLLAVVVGSGIMGERLAGGSVGLALLANTISTGAGLAVLITLFGPVSGAHFNPAVTLAFVLRGEIGVPLALLYVAAQVVGGALGTLSAHLMFEEALFQISTTARDGPAQWFSEFVATFGLVLTIFGAIRFATPQVAAMVGLYIASAYWFTASTSFANPAVTVARAISDTFAGIAPASAPFFIAAQLVGAAVAVAVATWLFRLPARADQKAV